jgi:5-keto-L-gluconate epimerase
MKLSVVVSTHQASFEAVSFKGSVEESLAAVAAAGYDGAELAVRNAGEVNGRELGALAQRLGLDIPAVGTGQMWGEERLSLTAVDEAVRQETISRVKQHIELARELDALVIIGLVRGVFPAPEYQEDSVRWLEAGLRELGSHAAERGVRIAIEAINRYETAYIKTVEEGMDILERVGSDAVGLLLDTFHMNIEEPSMEESIRRCGKKIFHFHVADSNRWYPGAGHIDFASLLKALESTGYKGYVSGEFLPQPDGATSIRKGLEYLKTIITD